MWWYLFEELADFYKLDHEHHSPGNFFAVWAKGEKDAMKTAERWSNDTDGLVVAGRYKNMKAAEKGARSRGKVYKSVTISFAVKDGGLVATKDVIKMNEGTFKLGDKVKISSTGKNGVIDKLFAKDKYNVKVSGLTQKEKGPRNGVFMYSASELKLDESFNVNAPTLNKLVNMEYSDPRQKDGCKIVAEKCGKLNDSDGSYIMYQDSALPGKYVAVHVSDDINEDSESANVSVVAIGSSKKHVKERMAYRIRRNKGSVNEAIKLNAKKIAKFIIKADKDIEEPRDWQKFKGTLQHYNINIDGIYGPDSAKVGVDRDLPQAIDQIELSSRQAEFIKDMKQFGYK